MPDVCCVPGCQSNYYKHDRVNVFRFPKDVARKKKWLSAIRRAYFTPSARAVVCINHFDEKFIIREDKMKRPDGTILAVKRDHLKLTPDAYPTIFSNFPTKALPPQRRKHIKIPDLSGSVNLINEENADDVIEEKIMTDDHSVSGNHPCFGAVIKEKPESGYVNLIKGENTTDVIKEEIKTDDHSVSGNHPCFSAVIKEEPESGYVNLIKEENTTDVIKEEIKTDDLSVSGNQPCFDAVMKEEPESDVTKTPATSDGLAASNAVPDFEKVWIKVEIETADVVADDPLSCCSTIIEQPDAAPQTGESQCGNQQSFSITGELAGRSGHAPLPKITEVEMGAEAGMPEYYGITGYSAGNLKRPLVCDVCSYTTSKAGNLKTHKMTHSGERPFVCDVCESRFTTAGNLKTHKFTHSGERPFFCDVCDSRFSQVSHLRNHRLTHTGERPFVCDICGSRFAVAGSLKRHRLIHSEEKPYACDLCESKFSQTTHLKKHKMTHTGEKPFVCDVCGARSTTSGNLRRHKKKHSGESVPVVVDPSSTCSSIKELNREVRR